MNKILRDGKPQFRTHAVKPHPPHLKPGLVISLDFELFWGVAESRALANYRDNIEGEWNAIPRILALFERYGVRGTWATVGMVMCRDHAHWCEVRPSVLPEYRHRKCSTYSLGRLAYEYPKLFFARPLVEQILATPGQELATHTYSHFYCGEEGVNPGQFFADLECAQFIAADMGVQYKSLVFPRNQVREEYLACLPKAGISVYRGNPDHYLYRNGHYVPGGLAGRALRFADSWIPLTGANVSHTGIANGLVNVPASLFLRPWSRRLSGLEFLRISRLKQAMTAAARTQGICHLWWHPHNFGVNVEQNLAVLEVILKHFVALQDQYGMSAMTMAESAISDEVI